MALRLFPAPDTIQAVEYRLIQPAQVNRSAWTGGRKVVGLPGGARWTAAIQLIPFVTDGAAAAWRGWLASLEGPVHTFHLPVLRAQHSGTNPTATAAAGSASATLSAAIGLKAGQYMTFTLGSGKSQMVILTQDMVGTTATFRPRLRENTIGEVETINPYAQVALSEDTVTWLSKPGRMFDFPALEVEEAF